MHTSTVALGKTRSLRMQDVIRQALEQDLRDGSLTPGMAIDEPALCARFGVSRTPVREALLLLSAKGLVDFAPRSGIYVRQLEARELVGMMEGLAELEAVLARLAALRIGPPLRERLQTALARTAEHQKAQDPIGYEHANAELHDLIYQASGNVYIVEQTRELRLRIAPYRRRLFEKPGRLPRSQSEHEAVVFAIVTGEPDKAADAMREHVWAGGQVFADAVLTAPLSAPAHGRRRPRTRRTAIQSDGPGSAHRDTAG